MNYCNNCIGDHESHLYIFCLKYGVRTALQCTKCAERKKSEARENAEGRINRREKA